jgi:hypothetical protein
MFNTTDRNIPEAIAVMSVLTNRSWMGKRFTIDDAGQLQKQVNGLFTRGSVSVRKARCANDLLDLIEALNAKDALCLGTPSCGKRDMSVVTRGSNHRLASSSKICITRTKDDFGFPDGEGWLLLDHDTRDLPASVQSKLADLGGIFAALNKIWHELAGADFLVRPSSSAGVYIAGETPANATGFHMFVRIKSAKDIPSALKALHARCWQNGLGYHLISKSGQMLDRSIIDISVGSPERLIFTSPPILGPNVLREAPPTVCHEGAALDAPRQPYDLAWSRTRDIARQNAKPEADARSAAFLLEAIEQRISAHGGTYAEAETLVMSRVQGRCLSDDDVLVLAGGKPVIVGDLLDQIKAGDVIPCADPIEGPDYNPTAAAVIWKPPYRTPALVSHAHGFITQYNFARFTPFAGKIRGASA